MEHDFLVRCNQCEHICAEDEIKIREEDVEYCDNCGTAGCLMDLGEFGKIDDKVAFPILSQCRDWAEVKANFDISTLCYFENEIHDYEYASPSYADEENYEDYPFIIYWFEGSVDTKELIEHYNEA